MFTDEGVSINLKELKNEVDTTKGNVWGLIFSLKREDAERLGYNTAEQWMNLLRSRRNDIAKEMNITPENLRWYAAYHNSETHPHVHMLVWSSNPQEPFLSTVGIHNIKHTVAGDIFRQDMISIYKKQTDVRNDLKETFRQKLNEILQTVQEPSADIPMDLYEQFSKLCEKLSSHKGKKVYGYLDKDTKKIVDGIVKAIANDKNIAEAYELWYQLQCETYRTYTDEMPTKIPLEENKEFKSIRNQVVSIAAEIKMPPIQTFMYEDYDYEELQDIKNDITYLSYLADRGNPIAMYRIGRYYYDNTDDTDEALYWFKKAADNGNTLSMYLIYKGYRDGIFNESHSDKMKYLLMAVDNHIGYAEYEYAKYLMDKSPEDAKIYFERAASHGSFQAEYTYGKMLYDEGKREEAREWFERSARTDAWTQTRVGLLLYYEYEDHEAGKAFLSSAAEKGYEPAREVLRSIEQGLNARIVIGVCDLFYYASNILDERCEDMYSSEHQIDYHGIDKKQRRENQAKRQGIIMY